jgi:site-specific DNA recombinase
LRSLFTQLTILRFESSRPRTCYPTGATRGGVHFGRGSLFYLLRNRFYIGEVKYKDEILPGEQPTIMDRALFDAVQQKLTDQWTTRSIARNASDYLLTGLLFDDAGHRMVPTHAAKSGVRYRYYVSLPHLHGESKIASVGSVSRIPATEIEDVIVKSLHEYLIAQKEKPCSRATQIGDRKVVQDSIVRIDVHEDHLAIRLTSAGGEETSDSTDDQLLSIPWQKPPSRRSRQILLPHGIPRDEVRPTRIERRARLVSAIARGRRWLNEIVSGSVTDVQQIATRQKCSARQVNMTISLAFLAPDLVRAAVEGRLPRGIGVERLRDAPAEWSQQFEALGLNPR